MLWVAQIIALILVIGAFFDAARRRTGNRRHAWPFVVIALAGFLVIPVVSTLIAASQGIDLGIWAGVLGWAWVFSAYGAIFAILGRGQRLQSSWSCPNCLGVNDANTLVCGCGQRAPKP
jgi:hypothetical protein